MGVSKNYGTPKSSILIGVFSIIFTLHFGGKPPIFGSTSIYICHMTFQKKDKTSESRNLGQCSKVNGQIRFSGKKFSTQSSKLRSSSFFLFNGRFKGYWRATFKRKQQQLRFNRLGMGTFLFTILPETNKKSHVDVK